MKKVIIKNLNGDLLNWFQSDNPEQIISECEMNNTWGLPEEYTVEIIDITYEHDLQVCINNRKAEYPTPEEFMNAFFDGGEVELQALNALRLAVKAKYPKPTQGEI